MGGRGGEGRGAGEVEGWGGGGEGGGDGGERRLLLLLLLLLMLCRRWGCGGGVVGWGGHVGWFLVFGEFVCRRFD